MNDVYRINSSNLVHLYKNSTGKLEKNSLLHQEKFQFDLGLFLAKIKFSSNRKFYHFFEFLRL